MYELRRSLQLEVEIRYVVTLNCNNVVAWNVDTFRFCYDIWLILSRGNQHNLFVGQHAQVKIQCEHSMSHSAMMTINIAGIVAMCRYLKQYVCMDTITK